MTDTPETPEIPTPTAPHVCHECGRPLTLDAHDGWIDPNGGTDCTQWGDRQHTPSPFVTVEWTVTEKHRATLPARALRLEYADIATSDDDRHTFAADSIGTGDLAAYEDADSYLATTMRCIESVHVHSIPTEPTQPTGCTACGCTSTH